MNWINNVVRPKIQGIWRKREMPEDRWVKCPETGQMVFYKDLEDNQFVIPGSNCHMQMTATTRLASVFDHGRYTTLELPEVPVDPLKFRDERRYTDRLRTARDNTELNDAVVVGEGTLDDLTVVAAVQDFKFMGGSLGMAAGEGVIAGMLRAVELKSPFIIFAASGGARMQEGVLSLMQMPRTTVAVQMLRRARLPYIVVLTHPTTGGVTASYAMLGDIHIAEPGALIGFAGPRVIEQTIREQLPEGFQRAEFLLDHGMVDMVVHRHKLRETLSRLCHVLMRRPAKVAEEPARDGEVLAASMELDADAVKTVGDGKMPGVRPDPAMVRLPSNKPNGGGPVHQPSGPAKQSTSGLNGAAAANGSNSASLANGHAADVERIEIVVSDDDEAVASSEATASAQHGKEAGASKGGDKSGGVGKA